MNAAVDPTPEQKEAIIAALDGLQEKGANTHGVSALVDSIKEALGVSYSDLARDYAELSLPGIKRWRDRNEALTSRLAPLVNTGIALVGGTPDESYPGLRPATVFAAVKANRIDDLEVELTVALKAVLGDCFKRCDIQSVAALGKSVKLELLID